MLIAANATDINVVISLVALAVLAMLFRRKGGGT